MRVLVCGGRDYAHWLRVLVALDKLHATKGITCVIHGAARGADALAGRWAEERGVPCESYPADWSTHGKRAGFLRNAQMLEQGKPDGVVAFPGGRGTEDMVRQSERAGLKVWRPFGP